MDSRSRKAIDDQIIHSAEDYCPHFEAGQRVRHIKYGWKATIVTPDHWVPCSTMESFASLTFRSDNMKPKCPAAFGSPDEFEAIS